MLDLITILSAVGLQQELSTSNGGKSLVARADLEENFLETMAGQVPQNFHVELQKIRRILEDRARYAIDIDRYTCLWEH